MMVNSQFIFECWEFSAIDQNEDRVCQIYVFKAFQTEQVRMELQEGGGEGFVYFCICLKYVCTMYMFLGGVELAFMSSWFDMRRFILAP